MTEIDETPLPGVGVRQDFGCRSGTRIGVITRPSGRRELLVYDERDPDAVKSSVDLNAEEAVVLGELLGARHHASQVEHLGAGIIPGLSIDWVPIPPDRPSISIADLQVRSRTGASVVAIVHQEEPIPAPGPDSTIHAGDTAVLVGTEEGIERATRLLETGTVGPRAPLNVAATGASPELLIDLGLLLLALAVLARVALRFGLSPIPFYLLVGLAAGEGGIADVEGATPFIEGGAQIGVVLLLFFLGLEYSARELVTSLRASSASGLLDLVLNFPPGLILGFALGWRWQDAVLMGGITYISSSGIIAKLLGDLGRLGNRETPAIISVLVFEDLVMAVFLPIVAALLIGGTLGSMAASVAVALAAVLAVLVVAWLFGPRLSSLVFTQSAEALLFGVLGATLLVAGIAEEVQVSAAVGAFLVGIALSGPAAEAAHGTLEPLRDLFAAAFFLFFAIDIDPSSIVGVAAVALVLALVSTGTKFATGWWAARRVGVATPGRVRAGTALVAHGEFSIVIAGLVVTSADATEIGEVTAGYVLFLAVAGPVLARYANSIARLFDGRAART